MDVVELAAGLFFLPFPVGHAFLCADPDAPLLRTPRRSRRPTWPAGNGRSTTRSPGSIACYLPRSRLLIAGDTIARRPDGQAMLGVFNVDPAAFLRSAAEQMQYGAG